MEVRRFLEFFPPFKVIHTATFFIVWHYLDHGLGEAKASFGIIKLPDGYFDDPNCAAV